MRRASRPVEDRDHADRLAFDEVENAVGKAPKRRSADSRIHSRMDLRVLLEALEHTFNLVMKGIAKPFTKPGIPAKGL